MIKSFKSGKNSLKKPFGVLTSYYDMMYEYQIGLALGSELPSIFSSLNVIAALMRIKNALFFPFKKVF